jgi:hypothetical protein
MTVIVKHTTESYLESAVMCLEEVGKNSVWNGVHAQYHNNSPGSGLLISFCFSTAHFSDRCAYDTVACNIVFINLSYTPANQYY